MKKIAVTGNHGEKVRSDCRVTVELMDSGGRQVSLLSKVGALFETSIRALIEDMLDFYELDKVKLTLEDSGALEHVIAARLEAAVRQLSNSRKEYLLPVKTNPSEAGKPDRFRLSRLYLPGNNPAMMINAGIHHPDGIILDLEDSVAPEKKNEARILVRNALRAIDFYGAERMVRINQLPLGLEDLDAVVKHKVELILIPKCEHAWQVKQVDDLIASILKEEEQENPVYIMPIIESALGVEHAFELASASKNVVAMAIGLEDLTSDLGVPRTEQGNESFYARTRVVNACKAAGIQPIDSVYSDVANEEGLRKNVEVSRSLGFEGMGCIHPAQIRIIQEGYCPGAEEIEHARKIIEAFEDAKNRGLGVVAIGSKMIDAPVVKRAEQTLTMAEKYGFNPSKTL